MNIDEFIEHTQETARKHRSHADFFESDNPMRVACIKSAEDCEWLADCLTKFKDYQQLEEQGLLLRLPYPLGTEYIYFVDIKDRDVYELDAEKIEVSMIPISKKVLYTVDCYEFLFEDFKKAIFLTREEAETRLKELISRKEQQWRD